MDINVTNVGPTPLIAALSRELGIAQVIKETVQWDKKQFFIGPGTHILAMVGDILHADTTARLVYG